MKTTSILCGLLVITTFAACQPKVQIVPSKDPIIIELNVNINQTIRVQLEEAAEDLIANNPDLF